MYAVVETGGKQYKVAKDDILKVEKLEGDAGAKVSFDNVLLLSEDGKKITLGEPTVSGASVSAEILEQKKDAKVLIFKKKRRKNHRRLNGHRQSFSLVKITGISASGGAAKKAAAPKADAKPAAEKKEAAPKKAPAKKPAAKKTTTTKKKED